MAKIVKRNPYAQPQGGIIKTPNHHQPPEQPRNPAGEFAPVDKSQCGLAEYTERPISRPLPESTPPAFSRGSHRRR